MRSATPRRTFLRLAASAATYAAGRYVVAEAVPPPPCAVDPTRFGAIGDGVTIETAAIQRAIDAAALAGNCAVYIPPGRYVTGTLLLKSGVTLSLDPAATLLGSLNPADYQLVEPFTDAVGAARGYALLACVDATNVSVAGGTIDGRGAELQSAAGPAGSKAPSARPFLVLCVRSTGISLRNIKLLNSSAWTLHIYQCSNATVDTLTIRSLGLANNDGIDIDSSSKVHIKGCTIDTGDDAICLKTTSSIPTRDITISDCTLTTRCAAFKIGTESLADFSRVLVTGCHVIKANLGAIKILSVDGAHISDVTVERMTVDDADTPIFLRLGARGRTFRPGDSPRPTGTLSGITLRDISALNARRIGILISGLPGHPIEDVTLRRIVIRMFPPSGKPIDHIPAAPPEAPAAYPEVRMFGADLPASVFYARHIRNLKTIDVHTLPLDNDPRPTRVLTDEHA